MQRPTARLLADGCRLHLHHGPIDLIVAAEGNRDTAFEAAIARFDTILDELVGELPVLRRQQKGILRGAVATHMQRAIAPYCDRDFVTPMAAVAGAVADTILSAMVAAAPLRRGYVNNGGDIAVWLTGTEQFRTLVAGPDNADLARIGLTATDPGRGIATSGLPGRSLSRGIADAVTVLAPNAAMADVAATLIANAVDLSKCAEICRAPACTLDPDSDLGNRAVVTSVGRLAPHLVDKALSNGAERAQNMLDRGLISGAALFLRGQSRVLGPIQTQQRQLGKSAEYA